MARDKPPRIYISAMETDIVGRPRFDAEATDLLLRLSEAGYLVHWEKEFRDYDAIERDIAASDALLAVVDRTWACSTWMAMEIAWAMGHFSMVNPPSPLMPLIPIFMYPVAADAMLRFPFNHHPPVLLDRDVAGAMKRIMAVLPIQA